MGRNEANFGMKIMFHFLVLISLPDEKRQWEKTIMETCGYKNNVNQNQHEKITALVTRGAALLPHLPDMNCCLGQAQCPFSSPSTTCGH